ncbi:N-acyl amino acid synthase FeeM domain-containing protein [Pyxidicoccus xibeiensis]|uniref:N-acyl amino acid synthase FeeM domain-containing protein n=1 Tax=Pyxidicoccus xibeiensis TaxID=2906759 RepID=UPI0020A7CDEF|nr:GNAT family N-acyltransferase [Pyxidicoccus xibeiensis]MCP3139292.1 GNAT family N-acetyltransferase [Pyxidicoccus xibeiensis]
MTTVRCVIASNQRQLDDALRVRWAVFGAELGLLGAPPPAPRDVSCFDTLETTLHFIVYADDKAVATSRLLLPNTEVARTAGLRLGIELEQKLDLGSVDEPGMRLAETTRYCVMSGWRGSEVLLRLQAEMYRASREHGVTHWIASANTETDSSIDALIAFQVAARMKCVSPRWKVTPHESSQPPETPEAPLYTPEERLRACQGHFDGLRLPRTLSLFAKKLGARFIGEPIYDARFHRYSTPLVAALDAIPSNTLAWFDSLRDCASRAA